MPKYHVTIREVVFYKVPVEAKDEDTAMALAEQKIEDNANRDEWVCDVSDRDPVDVTEDK